MTVTDALDAMRSELQGCTLVAFTDLSSNLVLCASSAARPAQEELDGLARAAQAALDGTLAEGAAQVWQAKSAQAKADTAMLLSESEARIFLRAPGESVEALVCVCAPDADLQAVLDCGRSTFGRIVENG